MTDTAEVLHGRGPAVLAERHNEAIGREVLVEAQLKLRL